MTLHKNTKIANAELIREETICSACEKELLQNTELTNGELAIILQSPLPSEITDIRTEGTVFSLMSQYSDIIMQGLNDLGCI